MTAKARRRTDPRPGIGTRSGREGVALVLALVFVALLTVLIVGFFYEMQVSASLAENQGSDFEAYLAAKSAVANGISLLADDQIETSQNGEPEYDSMMDPSGWSEGLPFEPINEAMMRTSISDEYGKINLNAIIQPDPGGGPPRRNEMIIIALHNFFALRSNNAEDSDPVDSLIDWLDYDDMDQEEPEGAENSYYMSLDNPYACKNGPMDSIEELLLIKGITPAVYFGDPEQEQLPLSEYLTVNGDPNGRVNVNTAPVEVLASVIGVQTGSADVQQAQTIYDQARTQPFEDLSRLGGFGAGMPGQQGISGTNTRPGTATQSGGSMGSGRTGGLMQKSLEGPEKQLGAATGSFGSRPGFGQPALTGTTRPVTNTGATAALTPLQIQQQQQQQSRQLFRVNSNVFRIHGDGMLEEVLVRIEAYVWRTPLDISELENGTSAMQNQIPVNPGTNPGTNPGGTRGTTGRSGIMKASTGTGGGVVQPGGPQAGVNPGAGGVMPGGMGNGALQAMADAYGVPLVPAEPFRIIDWKVIR